MRRHLLRSLLRDENGIKNVDRIANAIVNEAQSGKFKVAAFEAIRDTVDGRPSPDNEGASGQAIIVNTIFVTDDSE